MVLLEKVMVVTCVSGGDGNGGVVDSDVCVLTTLREEKVMVVTVMVV